MIGHVYETTFIIDSDIKRLDGEGIKFHSGFDKEDFQSQKTFDIDHIGNQQKGQKFFVYRKKKTMMNSRLLYHVFKEYYIEIFLSRLQNLNLRKCYVILGKFF